MAEPAKPDPGAFKQPDPAEIAGSWWPDWQRRITGKDKVRVKTRRAAT
jgi:poly(3-hydroxyalkanoate) synthetase